MLGPAFRATASRCALPALILVAALSASGCGSGDSSSSAPSSDVTTTEAAATTTLAPTAAPGAKTQAEQAVRDDLPDIPLWKGLKLRATVISDDQICVDRRLTKKNAEAVGGLRNSNVTVTFPALTLGEPQDGTCADAADTGKPKKKPKPEKPSASDKKIIAARNYYLRMDDYAIALEDAVHAAQDDEPGAAARIAALRSKILKRVNDYLLAGNDSSVGGNLLLSAATTASENVNDVYRLARVRKDIIEARSKLADEAMR